MHSESHKKSTYASLFKRLTVWTGVFAIFLTLLFTYSKTVHAGLLSFVSSLLESQQVSAQTNNQSGRPSNYSQIGAVLQAHSNFNPTSEVVAEVPPMVGETLVADLAGTNTAGSSDFNTQINTYVVREGDTISGVAKMFNVSINTVLWANNLTGRSVLQPGQTLVILPISGITYTVKKGDTLKGIAKKYGADHSDDTLSDILSYNDLSLASPLAAGQAIIIPNAELATPVAPVSSSRHITTAPREPLLDDVTSLPSYTGYYTRPIFGGTISQGLHGHNAIDFASPVGTPVYASAPGTVIISRSSGAWNGGYGNYVVISHPNGTQTLYAHMSKSIVSAGEQVSRGDTIGYIGMTGLTTGPHVHFEVRGARNPFQ